MNETLREAIERHLDDQHAPPGDVNRAISHGRRIRRRRRAMVSLASVGVVAAIGLVSSRILADSPHTGTGPDATTHSRPTPGHYPRLAAFDVDAGVRAWADPSPSGKVHLGDRAYPRQDMNFLDTDATATPRGMIFFDSDQVPRLLSPDGRVSALGDGPVSPDPQFHPSSKYDAQSPLVAWSVDGGDHVHVVVYDLAKRATVASRDVTCTRSQCRKVVVDGIDDGAVFVRAFDGTHVWTYADGGWAKLGGASTRVADVRGGTLLYTGPAPTLTATKWRYVHGEIDAQLTFDGRNVLYWSRTLKPTTAGGTAIRLNLPDAPQGGSWFTIDTDGSVLAAVQTAPRSKDGYLDADVYDCQVPSGHCTSIGHVHTADGDPEFIGNDM